VSWATLRGGTSCARTPYDDTEHHVDAWRLEHRGTFEIRRYGEVVMKGQVIEVLGLITFRILPDP
jgi:hypothetical protein